MPVHPTGDRSIEVRRRMRDAAADLIAQLGWNAVSTRNLAARAGVAPGLVHYHFPSLQALLREAALARMRGVLEESTAVLEHTAPDEGLEQMLAQLDAYTGQDPTSLLF
ncbi:MAG TPA: helix-turn-helix domain-containing protein, partial [Euzebya sp.]|nr:helix-turn-helix domain-containing protein [Euzebya sp.]